MRTLCDNSKSLGRLAGWLAYTCSWSHADCLCLVLASCARANRCSDKPKEQPEIARRAFVLLTFFKREEKKQTIHFAYGLSDSTIQRGGSKTEFPKPKVATSMWQYSIMCIAAEYLCFAKISLAIAPNKGEHCRLYCNVNENDGKSTYIFHIVQLFDSVASFFFSLFLCFSRSSRRSILLCAQRMYANFQAVAHVSLENANKMLSFYLQNVHICALFG